MSEQILIFFSLSSVVDDANLLDARHSDRSNLVLPLDMFNIHSEMRYENELV